MDKLKILIGVLAVVLLFLPGVVALEGESPADTFNRLTDEMSVVIKAASLFFIVVGAIMIVFGGASARIRAWGAGLVVAVFLGNFVLLAAPWFLDILRPGS